MLNEHVNNIYLLPLALPTVFKGLNGALNFVMEFNIMAEGGGSVQMSLH